MDLSKILSISGKPGLYRHVGQSKTGIVVESIIDGKRSSAFASEQISALNDISMYTNGEDIKLEDVFKNIFEKESGKAAISEKSSTDELKAYFEEVLPEYDKDRVYISDIKKVIKWYNILANNEVPEFTLEDTEEEKKNNENEEIKGDSVEKKTESKTENDE
jgi:hypothetical protein